MVRHDRLGFTVRSSSVRGNVLVPKYYDPEVVRHLDGLGRTHELVPVESLVSRGVLSLSTGDEIGKMAYGTGRIPFVRTSDISNWEVKADPKQGVSDEIYAQYRDKQDVRAGDLLFVRDGTYLIGNACIITETDTEMLYQSHILKIRVNARDQLEPELVLALLTSPVVKRQIRAKQFTADIVDTVGNRFVELVLPVPMDRRLRTKVAREVRAIVAERNRLREVIRSLPLWAEGIIAELSEPPPDLWDEEEGSAPGFLASSRMVLTNILVPRYYDPRIEQRLREFSDRDLVSLGELAKNGILSFDSGIEVGKMAYGTGPVPFIRTSDISNWELKGDPKQSVSEELYEEFRDKLDVRAGDIFVVRDGTYLVGTSCILTERDTRVLYCGGIYKLRVKRPDVLDPYLLLALLNSPIVRRQMRAKQFTRDIIDTLGKRIYEVVLPIPKDPGRRREIAEETRETVETRAALRDRAKEIALEVEGIERVSEEDKELLQAI